MTFRQLSAEEIIDLVRRAGLECIEWGGDIHVPHGDVAKARQVRDLTQDAGLETAAYGSYYQVGESEEDGLSFRSVLETARALAAPSVRVWAGSKGSDEADSTYRAQVVEDAVRIAGLAAQETISVSFEFHRNTLTDSNEAAAALLRACHHDNLYSFWQPPHHTSTEYRAAGLSELLPRLTNLHVFYWPEPGRRRPLKEATAEWQHYLDIARTSQREHPVLLEFVEADSIDAFLRDAKTLRSWLEDFADQPTPNRQR